MGSYHNQLDKKYFHKSVYIKKWEETFNVKIKDYPLQYELVFETYNTLIKYNNILFSKNYIAKSKKVDKIINLLNEYLNTYKNKINKSFDSQCILFYNNFEYDIFQLKEMKELYEKTGKKYNLTSFEEDIEDIIFLLNHTNFDCIKNSNGITYHREPNDKLPKQIKCQLQPYLETYKTSMMDYNKQKNINDEFIKKYFDKTGIDLTQDGEQRENIFMIHTCVQEINNFLVNYFKYKNIKQLQYYIDYCREFLSQDFTFLEDIYYKNLVKRLSIILNLICEKQLSKAYNEIQKIIKENNNLYERIS